MFVGRERELRQLQELIGRSGPGVAVVFGRRRIGKTELIRRACEGTPALFFEGLENQPKQVQIRNFLFQIRVQTNRDFTREDIRDWREALVRLLEVLGPDPGCVVLDEFQWMANYRSEIVSDLKMVWDQYLSRLGDITLILCGSIASFITERLVKSSAFYGRTDLAIHVRAFCLAETRQMLHGHGQEEVLDAQMLVGGVPKYLDLLRTAPSVRLGLETLAFSPDGYFMEEYDRIFLSHFGRNPDYERIVRALAKRPYGLFRRELAEQTGVDLGGGLSERLGELEAAGFISSATPFNRGRPSRTLKYFLTDSYLRFYFAFIRPNAAKIGSGLHPTLLTRLAQTGKFHAWMGRSFEYVCLAHASRITELLGFSGIDFSCGPYFERPSNRTSGVQIDLAFDRADKVITLCEMKRSIAPVGTGIIQEIESKVAVLQRRFPRRTIQRALILSGRASRELLNAGYFYRVIHAEELF